MKKQILTIGLAAVASVASAASPAFTTAAERVDSLMRCLFHDGEPGAAVVVAKNDDVIVDSGYGVADIVTGDRIDGNTMFNIASISKQFTVAGVLSLADRGLLRADNAVADFLPYESVGYGFRKKFSVNLMVGEQLIHIKEIFHAAIAFVSVNHCVKLFCY